MWRILKNIAEFQYIEFRALHENTFKMNCISISAKRVDLVRYNFFSFVASKCTYSRYERRFPYVKLKIKRKKKKS